MTTITLPPEVEAPLAEEARRQGTTTELLALDKLRALIALPDTNEASADDEPPSGETLYDFLQGYVGAVDGTTEALSEDCGRRFTEGLAARQREGKL